jgi:hypothetical protein
MREAGWRILVVPGKHPVTGMKYALDNGAWSAFQQGREFDQKRFAEHVERHGGAADFIVIPDVVAEASKSWELSLRWIPRLKYFRLLLFAVQDGMNYDEVGELLLAHPGMGIFLGGSTAWKLKEMYSWGVVAHALGRHYHVARVNTAKRIRLAAESGAHSFDGSSVSRYAETLPLLEDARRQPSLLTPRRLDAVQG